MRDDPANPPYGGLMDLAEAKAIDLAFHDQVVGAGDAPRIGFLFVGTLGDPIDPYFTFNQANKCIAAADAAGWVWDGTRFKRKPSRWWLHWRRHVAEGSPS